MKKYIYLLTIAALAVFGCTVTGPQEEEKAYAGNTVKVTLNDTIPVAGGTVKAQVVSEVPFTVSIPSAATWLTAEATDTEVRFTAPANQSAEMRYASVALIDAEKKIAITRFDVCQKGSYVPVEKKEFGVSTKEVSVASDVTSATFEVTGEVAWTATSSNEAVVVEPAAGEGNATVTLTFPANNTPEEIRTEIAVATEDPGARPKSFTIVLTQESAVKNFNVTVAKANMEQYEDRTTIIVESDVDWTLTSSNETFYLLDPATEKVASTVSGSGDAEILMLVSANFKLEEAKTTITATTEDPLVQNKTITFDVSQKAYTIPSGQVLAEWYFAESQKSKLEENYNLVAKSELAHLEGFGDLYVDANSQGVGKFQYWQVDKEPIVDKLKKRCKRTITGKGEPMAVPPYVGDYALWTANPSAPLAAGTKVHIFFTVRPNDPQICKYWLLEYLDGTDTWKPVSDLVKKTTTANGEIEYTHELIWNDRQYNTFVDAVVTLSAETPVVQFRFKCVDNTMCDGTPWGDYVVDDALELRFSGWDSTNEETNPQYGVKKRPVIEVIQ